MSSILNSKKRLLLEVLAAESEEAILSAFATSRAHEGNRRRWHISGDADTAKLVSAFPKPVKKITSITNDAVA
jgi:hypothetical protein